MTIQELIDGKIQVTGKWWFEPNRRRQFVGTIKFGKQIKLEISGVSPIDFEANKFSEIRGKGAGGERFILTNSYVSESSHPTGGYSGRWQLTLVPTDVLSFTSSLVGRNVTTKLTHLEAELPYFDFWLDNKMFDTSFQNHTITFKENEEVTIDLDNAKLIFSTRLMGIAGWNINTRNKMDIRQRSFLRLEYPEEVEYSEALALYRRIESFFRFASVSSFYMRDFTGMTMHQIRIRGNLTPEIELKDIYLNRWIDRTIEVTPSIIDQLFLFKYKDLANPEATIKKWLEIIDALQPVYQLLLTSQEAGVYLEQRFISLTTAIEIFHRRFHNRTRKPEDEWLQQKDGIIAKHSGRDRKLVKGRLRDANEVTLEDRINDLIQLVNNTGFRGVMPTVVENIAKTRNDFVHEDFGANTLQINLFQVSEIMSEILIRAILLELGFNEDEIFIFSRNSAIFRYSNGLIVE